MWSESAQSTLGLPSLGRSEGKSDAVGSKSAIETRARQFSSVPWLAVLLIGTLGGLWAGYLRPNQAVIFGQSLAVLIPIFSFVLALALWILQRPRSRASNLGLIFLGFVGLSWIAAVLLYRFHGDSFTYGALLFLPVLFLIGKKPPSYDEVSGSLVAFAWAVSTVLITTRLLEMVGVIDQKYQPDIIIWFDETYYWLPLNDWLGIEGRWPGPFGHNGYTAMMGALIIVIALAFPTRGNWLFLITGAATLLVTSSRASVGAAAAGAVIIALFTERGLFGRIPRKWRLVSGLILLVGGLATLLSGKSGLTGRQDIWPAFLELGLTSPWVGVGSSGIEASGGLTQDFGHAHNMYLDLFVRYGAVSLAIVTAVLALGLVICLRAALRGYSGPMAILVFYMITAITEPRNDWIHPSLYVLVVVLSVMAALAALRPNGLLMPCTSGPQEESRESPSGVA